MTENPDGTFVRHEVGAGPVRLEERRQGQGDPLVYLHGEDGLLFSSDLLAELGKEAEVRAPTHPGWGGSERPAHLTSMEDLSFVYLDYLEGLGGGPVPLVGSSLGAWLAASIAVKNSASIAALVLVAPVGIKVSDRETRDFLDIYASNRRQVEEANYGEGARPDLLALGPEDFEYLARAQESVARFAFRPYLYDPKLIHRLRRITVPTLIVWSSGDRLIRDPEGYAAAYAAAIGPNARTVELPGCGHRIEEQRPAELASLVAEFVQAQPTPAVAGNAVGAAR